MTFPGRLLARRARGIAMFEVVCALSVIAAVIVGAVLLYQSVTASNARAELVQLSRELRGGVERAWVGMGSYEGLRRPRRGGSVNDGEHGLRALCRYGAVPASAMTAPDDCDRTHFVTHLSDAGPGHSIGLWAYRGNKQFYLGFKAICPAACRALLMGCVGQTDNRSNFYGVSVRKNVGDLNSFWDVQEPRFFGGGGGGAKAPYKADAVDGLCTPRGRGYPDTLHVFLAFR